MHPFDCVISRFLFYYLRSQAFTEYVNDAMTGMAYPAVNDSKMSVAPFPLPPLAEQKRIVAKVDELMARCDELEARQNERHQQHAALVSSCLHRLASPPKPETRNLKPPPSPFILHPSTFNLLFSSPKSIAELRKTILQLAVQGRLVKQGDEAETTYSPLQTKKKNTRKCGVPMSPLVQDGMPFSLPRNWCWIRFGELTERLEYGTSQKASENMSGVPVLRMNNIQSGRLDFTNMKYLPQDCPDLPKLFLSDGDIIFNRTNSAELVGKSAVFNGEADTITFASYLIRASLDRRRALPAFFNFAINSDYYRHTQIEPTLVQQCGQANFSGSKLAASAVPLPPLAEQKRIVAKVDELMAMCDTLEAKLSQSQGDADTLTDAVVHLLCNSCAK